MSTVDLPVDIAGDQAAALLPRLRQQVQAVGAGQCTLNAAAVQRFDSASLALLLECRRIVLAQSGRLHIVGLPAGLQSMAQAYGVDVLLADASTVPVGGQALSA